MSDASQRADLPRFLAAPFGVGITSITLDEDESRHALTVLRMRGGERAIVVDLCGHVALGVLEPPQPASGRKAAPRAVVRVERVDSFARPANPLTLIVAAPKGPRLDWLVEKCTELGVSRLVLAEFERSVVRVGEGVIERQRRRSAEACKQCERAWAMEIEGGGTLSDELAKRLPTQRVLIAHPAADAMALSRVIAPAMATIGVVGPEGGMTANELAMSTSCSATFVSLGANILRVETAAIAMAAMLAM